MIGPRYKLAFSGYSASSELNCTRGYLGVASGLGFEEIKREKS